MYFFEKGAFKIILCSLALALAVSSANAQSRILNGLVITIDKAPYMVQIRNEDDTTICGGTLVTPQHVVTAVHCLDDYEDSRYKNLSVMAGVSTKSGTGERRLMSKVFLHRRPYDVAVVKLDRPLPMTKNIQFMGNICSKPLQAMDEIQVSGWGAMHHEGPLSEELRTVTLPILPQEECKAKTPGLMFSSRGEICAYSEGHDSCVTDSGGPGIFENELCAIVSWGERCGKKDAPGVYANVYAARDFIEKHMKS